MDNGGEVVMLSIRFDAGGTGNDFHKRESGSMESQGHGPCDRGPAFGGGC